MPRWVPILPLVCFLVACQSEVEEPDAYGTFEAREVTVSTELGGRLLVFSVQEGENLEAGAWVSVTDTSALVLQRRQLELARKAGLTAIPSIQAEIAVLQEQQAIAKRELDRVGQLLAGGAATTKQRDDLDGQIAVMDRSIHAARTRTESVYAQAAVLSAQIDQVQDQIHRHVVRNPIRGTVLSTLVEPGEMIGPGRPLYTIAPLDTLDLRAYISGSQLTSIRLGQRVDVLYDGAEGLEQTSGIISWIAAEAQFTPKLVQTREERVNLVYAVRVRVPNPDGALKVGMPGEFRR